MSIRVITISREFGSGGRSVGKLIAEKLGWKYYDKEIVDAVAKESGFSRKFIEENGEYANVTSSFLYNLSVGASMENGTYMLQDEIYNVQSRLIQGFADEGNCVIVGRCADYILGERDDCLNVFVYADKESRKQRILELYGETDKPIEKRLSEKDKRRKIYYKSYTNRSWGEMRNYHLSIDCGKLGVEKCAEIIVSAVK